MEKLALVLIRNDRRLIDHEALIRAQEFPHFFLLATLPPQWSWAGRVSEKRKSFIKSSLNQFAKSLGPVPLHFSEYPLEVIEFLQQQFEVSVFAEEQGAEEEILPFPVIKTRPNVIFDRVQLYPTFTPFRSHIPERCHVPFGRAELDPGKAVVLKDHLFKFFDAPDHPCTGEENALKRVSFYLENHLATYQDTRNYLEDENGSSKFSYFLSQGELSAAWLYQSIAQRDEKNWLNVELLWREFFWHSKIDFKLESRGHKIGDWESKLKHPLAKAIKNELFSTGYISNRSRQILASYLIYELGMDWKRGGAIYEEHLLDYDVFVNWGNWQYIAGVKFDPRGGRKFNLDLQVEKYDPDERYIRNWLPKGT
jgi:deoxyribodipyrimidine photo-lyase